MIATQFKVFFILFWWNFGFLSSQSALQKADKCEDVANVWAGWVRSGSGVHTRGAASYDCNSTPNTQPDPSVDSILLKSIDAVFQDVWQTTKHPSWLLHFCWGDTDEKAEKHPDKFALMGGLFVILLNIKKNNSHTKYCDDMDKGKFKTYKILSFALNPHIFEWQNYGPESIWSKLTNLPYLTHNCLTLGVNPNLAALHLLWRSSSFPHSLHFLGSLRR